MPWQKPKATDGFNLDVAIVLFETVWPGRFREGDIAWRYFWFLYRGIPQKLAIDRVNITRASAIAFSGSDDAKREGEKDRKEAFPT